ncbi:MAG: hypothetical protein WCY36_00405 [Candidatus Omnitrophota bacterium]
MVPSPKTAFMMELARNMKPVVIVIVIAALVLFVLKKMKKRK